MDLVSDSFLSTTNFMVTYNYEDKTTVSPVATWTTDRDFDLDVTTKTLNLGVDVSQQIIPETLTGSLNYSMNRDWAEDNSVDALTHTMGANLTWTAVESAQAHPGLRLSLLGSYAHSEDDIDPSLSTETFQLFLNGTLFWNLIY